jgi:hypothetical protein
MLGRFVTCKLVAFSNADLKTTKNGKLKQLKNIKLYQKVDPFLFLYNTHKQRAKQNYRD